MVVDLEHSEAKLLAPSRLVFDEVELVDQRPDRRLSALQEVDLASPRVEVGPDLRLVRLIVGDLPDGGEGLKRLTVGVCSFRRVDDNPVTSGHLAQHVRLAVVGLGKATPHPLLDMVTADRIDPIRHARTLSRAPDTSAFLDVGLWIPERTRGGNNRRAGHAVISHTPSIGKASTPTRERLKRPLSILRSVLTASQPPTRANSLKTQPNSGTLASARQPPT
ncbi:hypothetical protein JMUB5695_03486 [Mycobacterium heckeshornense]|uniref:Uncharacterized protein n=1 Tax=Mycobacterium heckeshornense TaxID=110505 RepID=A0A7R7TXG0_9MYCO|nr:hypothetical protein MHEC_35850 [Mycobacterium heckeshornense]BCQ10032.1 hypothetical protein JMUB5695_03486 [Mycobacterium heckeshornense]